ncbi:hypothetical protein NXC24_PB00292 (plasmid) [Rhizobium sp. NXC24]|nr:hypothetical protein NXC24_PB00292 [Rhizobium sp. NXC24]
MLPPIQSYLPGYASLTLTCSAPRTPMQHPFQFCFVGPFDAQFAERATQNPVRKWLREERVWERTTTV